MFQENPSFQLVEMKFRANNGFSKKKKKAVNKRILFPLNKNPDFTSLNEGFNKKYVFIVPKNCFHQQEYIYIKKNT